MVVCLWEINDDKLLVKWGFQPPILGAEHGPAFAIP
jgi:hypothetical protein